jgi:hypothetical protein
MTSLLERLITYPYKLEDYERKVDIDPTLLLVCAGFMAVLVALVAYDASISLKLFSEPLYFTLANGTNVRLGEANTLVLSSASFFNISILNMIALTFMLLVALTPLTVSFLLYAVAFSRLMYRGEQLPKFKASCLMWELLTIVFFSYTLESRAIVVAGWITSLPIFHTL